MARTKRGAGRREGGVASVEGPTGQKKEERPGVRKQKEKGHGGKPGERQTEGKGAVCQGPGKTTEAAKKEGHDGVDEYQKEPRGKREGSRSRGGGATTKTRSLRRKPHTDSTTTP